MRLGLIECDGVGPFSVIRPAHGVTARLLGMPPPSATPPGTTRVRYRASWDDLVLPGDRVAMMREYVGWIRHRSIVIDEWAGRPSGGPVALFSGPSGTGKTLAAAVIASELGWPLYRVDLGSLVSKYIGETEKNLNVVFAAVHGQPAVLQFDEADSLFGKRGEIRDARDRYANLEVSHLLARIEQHDGPCILTTNLRGNLDPAFARRFQMVIDFPRPDLAARSRLWRLHLPPKAPLEPAPRSRPGGRRSAPDGRRDPQRRDARRLPRRGRRARDRHAGGHPRDLARTRQGRPLADGRRSRAARPVRAARCPVLTIDTLRLQLPAGFEGRAERIGRLLGDALARIDTGAPGAELTLERLAPPPITIAPGASDFDVAAGIASSVSRQIAAARRQGDR